jgi:predicted nucleotidyltransferase
LTTDVVYAPGRKVTLTELRAHRDEIEEIGRRYGVSNIRVFGSVARGDADDNSDLDLLIDASAETGLFDLAGFALDVDEEIAAYQRIRRLLAETALSEGESAELIATLANGLYADRQDHDDRP